MLLDRLGFGILDKVFAMREYLSILGPSGAPHEQCIAFYKYDGSNLRWEWRPKKGWSKFGTRRQLFDETHEIFKPAIEIFQRKYAEPLEKVIKDTKEYRNAEYATAFTEFLGPKSFAGWHELEEPKDLILFDIQIYKKGIIGPREFLKRFGHLEIPRVVYEGVLNESFKESVRNSLQGDGQMDLNEGVICKGGHGHELWMRKIKTMDYLKRLKEKFGEKWEEFWE